MRFAVAVAEHLANLIEPARALVGLVATAGRAVPLREAVRSACWRLAGRGHGRGRGRGVRLRVDGLMRDWVAAFQGDLAAAMKAFGAVASGPVKTCNYWPTR